MTTATISAEFARADVELIDSLVDMGFFGNRADLIKESVRHYIHEIADRELVKRIPHAEATASDAKQELAELKGIRKKIMEKIFMPIRVLLDSTVFLFAYKYPALQFTHSPEPHRWCGHSASSLLSGDKRGAASFQTVIRKRHLRSCAFEHNNSSKSENCA